MSAKKATPAMLPTTPPTICLSLSDKSIPPDPSLSSPLPERDVSSGWPPAAVYSPEESYPSVLVDVDDQELDVELYDVRVNVDASSE